MLSERVYPFKIIEYSIEVEDSTVPYNISFLDESGRLNKVEHIKGSWRKLVVAPNLELPLHLSSISFENLIGKMYAEIKIDGITIKEDQSEIGAVNLLTYNG